MPQPHQVTGQPNSDRSITEALSAVPRTAWRILARNEARALLDQLREAEHNGQLDANQREQASLIRDGLARAASAAGYRPRGRNALEDWYSGAGVETAWSELHRAGERLLLILDPVAVKQRVNDIDAALRSNLKADDPRLTPAVTRLRAVAQLKPAEFDPAVREELRGYQELANTTSDEAHANVRSLRNLLIVVGASLSLGLTLLTTLHALAPTFLDLSGPFSGSGVRSPDAVEVWEVIAVGALGGAIAAVFTVAKLGGYAGPYRLPVYQALIRVPAGAAVSLAAVLLLQSGAIKGLNPQNGLAVLGVALVFGYAPDILLRMMDQRATSLLGQAQSKNNPARPPLTEPRVKEG
jgi:hypothetical protein